MYFYKDWERGENFMNSSPEYFETKQNNNNKPFFQFLICFQICCIVRWEEMEGNHRKIHINNIKQKPLHWLSYPEQKSRWCSLIRGIFFIPFYHSPLSLQAAWVTFTSGDNASGWKNTEEIPAPRMLWGIRCTSPETDKYPLRGLIAPSMALTEKDHKVPPYLHCVSIFITLSWFDY